MMMATAETAVFVKLAWSLEVHQFSSSKAVVLPELSPHLVINNDGVFGTWNVLRCCHDGS